MQVMRLTDESIKAIINGLTIDEQTRDLLIRCIENYAPSYIHLLHALFNESSSLYQPVLSQDSYLGNQRAEDITGRFQTLYSRLLNGRPMDHNTTFVADKLDVVYGISCTGQGRANKFNDQVYEDLYNTLEEVVGRDAAAAHMEGIFDAIENLMAHIEAIAMRKALRDEDSDNNVSIHVTIHQDGLLVAVF